MLIKPFHTVCLFTLALSTMMACSASSWVLAWVGLEVNLMSFIPLILIKLTPSNTESSIKYFLVQAMASMIIIFLLLTEALTMKFFLTPTEELISMSLGLKAGMAPLHFWFPQVTQGLNWMQISILLTWQKIAPIILLAYTMSKAVLILITLSALTGAIIGLNQILIKKILAFSSIINASWLVSVSFLSIKGWLIYFSMYSAITLAIVVLSNNFFLVSINDSNFLGQNKLVKMLMYLNIFSLAGMPPFTGFFIKILVIQLMMNVNMSVIIMLIMLLSSIISFYFYLRLVYFMIFKSQKFISLYLTYTQNFLFISGLTLISIFLNMGAPLMSLLS